MNTFARWLARSLRSRTGRRTQTIAGICCLLSMLLGASLLLGGSASAASGQRCFAETGYCIAGRIREFWEQNGGLSVFGYPTGPQEAVEVEGTTVQAQPFERNRLELHPENARPYDVQLGRLGADALSDAGQSYPAQDAQTGCRYFAQTGQNVCGQFLSYWSSRGLEFDGRAGASEAESTALFGLPISGPHTETLSDGQQHMVQWFERARFELHEQNKPGQQVLLGLLGNERRGRERRPPPPPPTPTRVSGEEPTATPASGEPTATPATGEPTPTPADDERPCPPPPPYPAPRADDGSAEQAERPCPPPPPRTREPEPTRVPGTREPEPTRPPRTPEPTRPYETREPEPTRVPPPPPPTRSADEPTRVPPPPPPTRSADEPTRVPPPPTPTRRA
jgi:hypothetical protein